MENENKESVPVQAKAAPVAPPPQPVNTVIKPPMSFAAQGAAHAKALINAKALVNVAPSEPVKDPATQESKTPTGVPPVITVEEPKIFDDETPIEPKSAEPIETNSNPSSQVETPAEDVDEIDYPEPANPSNYAENFRKLRTAYKETNKTAKQLKAEKEAAEARIKKLESGEEVPEYVEKIKTRVTQLEPLEHIHNIKNSDVYRTTIVEPYQKEMESLDGIAKEYDIEPSLLQQASHLEGAALNNFLTQEFDQLGALEAKAQIRKVQDIRKKAKELEQKPIEYGKKLQDEHNILKAEQDRKRKNAISQTAKSAWGEALQDILAEGKVLELIPREDDSEFNEKYPYAIQKRAAEDYGATIRELADGGTVSLSPKAAKALATAHLLAIASSVAVARAAATAEHANRVEERIARQRGYSRPALGEGAPGASPRSTPPKAPTAESMEGAFSKLALDIVNKK